MIIASAVKIKDEVFIGKRHGDAICQAMNRFNVSNYTSLREQIGGDFEDGFITSGLKFLNRQEAYIYANKNGQFKRREIWLECHPNEEYNGYGGTDLWSEDLW